MTNNFSSLHPLLALFLNHDGGDSGWSMLAPLVNSLDDLTSFEKTLLPLAYERWHQSGRNMESMSVLRGIYRRTLVRNRLFLIERTKILQELHAAQIDALVFKGGGLLGRLLPEKGLRAISDIDIWVRPSQLDLALQVLGCPGKGLIESSHAVTIDLLSGLQLDLHMLPSHIFTWRHTSKKSSEAMFNSAYQRSDGGVMSTSDLLYYSFLNPLFAHAPGEDRAAFALIELNEALAASSITDDVLRKVLERIQDDRTAAVFLEHYEWLGAGLFPSLDRFISMAVAPGATDSDLELVRNLSYQLQKPTGQDEHELYLYGITRSYVLALRMTFGGKLNRHAAILYNYYAQLQYSPGILFFWLSRRTSWQRLWKIIKGIVRA